MSRERERRRAPRVRFTACATLETKGHRNANDQAFCLVQDASRCGIGLETGQPPLVGQVVLLRLSIDDRLHELRTLATRVQRRGSGNFFDIGLDWSHCSREQLAFLDEALSILEPPLPAPADADPQRPR